MKHTLSLAFVRSFGVKATSRKRRVPRPRHVLILRSEFLDKSLARTVERKMGIGGVVCVQVEDATLLDFWEKIRYFYARLAKMVTKRWSTKPFCQISSRNCFFCWHCQCHTNTDSVTLTDSDLVSVLALALSWHWHWHCVSVSVTVSVSSVSVTVTLTV